MKDDKYFWDFSKEPGMKLKEKYNIKNINIKPLVTIITSYFNGNEFMDQTINCVLNQTFPFWEWVIVDDGSTEKEALEYLEKVKQLDNRIRIYHKENEGLAKGRDYAIKYATTNYILPLDSDDLIEETYIETLYWTLETNKKAAWAFTDSVGFGKWLYLSDKKFDSDIMKTENQITATALIRKNEITDLGGYGVAKRYVNEDYHLWLRLLAKGKFPVQVTYYGFWYRRRKESLLTEINDEKSKENELRLRDLKEEADKINEKVNAIIFDGREIKSEEHQIISYPQFPENISKTLLYILPNTGISTKTFEEIKKQNIENNQNQNNKKEIIIITLENTNQSQYALRQQYEEFATVYNLTSFLNKEYYTEFINYIIKTRDVDKIYTVEELKDFVNSAIDKNNDINENAEIIEYKLDEEVYKKQIAKYKRQHTLLGRGIRKIKRMMKS